jgi:molecular chaperone DnaJ
VRSRRTVTVQVPAGVGDGMRIRMASQGEVGPGGGPAGDLYIEVSEERHDYFTRDGVDLHCHVSLPMTAAALGATLPQRTLEGEEELTIEPGTQPNTTLTLRGKGMPRLRSTGRTDGRGDLLVHLDVQVPDRLDARQTELLRELAALRGEEQPEYAGQHRNGLFGRRKTAGRGR